MEGWIKLHRVLLDSQIFASEKGLKIWIWILLRANHKQKFVPIKIGKGESVVTVDRGEFIFGRFSAEEDLNIDGSTIYKWIKKMELLEMITIKSNSHYSILKVNKFNDYNDIENIEVATIEQPSNNQVTTIEQPLNTNKNEKNVKNEKKIFIAPNIEEVKQYFKENNYKEETAIKFFQYYSVANWIDSRGNKVRSWKQKAQSTWFKDENKISLKQSTFIPSPR